jgi:hypothetical protein
MRSCKYIWPRSNMHPIHKYRRILRKIAAGEEDTIGDTSTLADETVVPRLVEKFKALNYKR